MHVCVPVRYVPILCRVTTCCIWNDGACNFARLLRCRSVSQPVHMSDCGLLILILAAAVEVLGVAIGASLPLSPCPHVYTYEETDGEVRGLISMLTPAKYKEVNIKVVLSSQVPLAQDEVGELNIKGGKTGAQEATRHVLQGQPHLLQYHVHFPNNKPVPSLLKITVNDREFCTANSTPAGNRAQITLTSFLATGVDVPQSNDFRVVGTLEQPPLLVPDIVVHSSDDIIGEGWTTTPHLPEYLLLISQLMAASTTNTVTITTSTIMPPHTTPKWLPQNEFGVFAEDFKVDLMHCGVSEPIPNQLVVHGYSAAHGEWPWQTAIFKNTDTSSSTGIAFQCGGTLITRRHVVTAAHCVVEKRYNRQQRIPNRSLVIYLGKHNIRSWAESGQQAFDVEDIFVHPEYNERYNNDIAVILLASTVQVTEFVKPVCLWEGSPDLSHIVGQFGAVAGWGRDDSGILTDTLHVAKMPVVSQETCLRSDTFYNIYTTEKTLCAGFKNGTTVCNGDSGGGLHLRLNNPHQNRETWYLRGVVSISMLDVVEQHCDYQNYVVFTDVAKHLPWLTEQLQKLPA